MVWLHIVAILDFQVMHCTLLYCFSMYELLICSHLKLTLSVSLDSLTGASQASRHSPGPSSCRLTTWGLDGTKACYDSVEISTSCVALRSTTSSCTSSPFGYHKEAVRSLTFLSSDNRVHPKDCVNLNSDFFILSLMPWTVSILLYFSAFGWNTLGTAS